MKMDELQAWTPEEFEAKLRAKSVSYHIHHPFQVMMHEGKCSRAQLQAWVANRYYYQVSIPSKASSMPARVSSTRSGESSSRMGLVLLMWISTLRGFA